ncbi:hypothetical protein A2292_00320 [candidate division WOR-1 bacterium RIFOXYB2_FULL_46_45]|nr:MAG: hypothetical protein A2292_00320 [candidate division WOR-1 bacterium RIFOXYB2_FULL_46_45]
MPKEIFTLPEHQVRQYEESLRGGKPREMLDMALLPIDTEWMPLDLGHVRAIAPVSSRTIFNYAEIFEALPAASVQEGISAATMLAKSYELEKEMGLIYCHDDKLRVIAGLNTAKFAKPAGSGLVLAHTHLNVQNNPLHMFPSGHGGDMTQIRRNDRSTQAIIHDHGVTFYYPTSHIEDVDGAYEGEWGKIVSNVRIVPSLNTQLTFHVLSGVEIDSTDADEKDDIIIIDPLFFCSSYEIYRAIIENREHNDQAGLPKPVTFDGKRIVTLGRRLFTLRDRIGQIKRDTLRKLRITSTAVKIEIIRTSESGQGFFFYENGELLILLHREDLDRLRRADNDGLKKNLSTIIRRGIGFLKRAKGLVASAYMEFSVT